MENKNDIMSMFKGLIPDTEPSEQDLRIKQKATDQLEELLNGPVESSNPTLIQILYQISRGVKIGKPNQANL